MEGLEGMGVVSLLVLLMNIGLGFDSLYNLILKNNNLFL